MRFSRGAFALAVLTSVLPAPAARAQVESPGLRLGAFTFLPAVSFSSGWNSNVNREQDAVSAYENTLHSHLGYKVAGGRLELEGFGAVEFSRYSVPEESGHSLHSSTQLSFGGPVLRLRAVHFYRDGGARPSDFDEIALQSRRKEHRIEGGIEWHVGARVFLAGDVMYSPTRYDADVLYQGSALDEKLNFDRTGYVASAGYEISPLTRVVARAQLYRDRFLKSDRLDTDNVRIEGGFEFRPAALLSGAIYVGVVNAGAPDPGAPDYSGLALNGTLSYSRAASTLAVFRLSRDTQYSVDVGRSYYVTTLVDASLRQDLFGPVEGFVYGTWFTIDYQGDTSVPRNTQPGFGGGTAVRIGRFLRVGMDADWTRRRGSSPWTSARVIGFLAYGTGFRQVERPLPSDRYR